MAFQSTIGFNLGTGVPGDKWGNQPSAGESYILNSASAANNIIGSTIFTKGYAGNANKQGFAAAGGTNAFAGLLVNSKAYASYGTSAGGPLAPTLTLANNVQAEISNQGSWVVTLPAAAAIGDVVIYDTTTGQISTIIPGAALPVGKAFAQALVDIYTVTAAGLAVITLSPTYVRPV